MFNLPVTPYLTPGYLGRAFPIPAGYYGLPFQAWRGGMEYIIYIPSSSNMRGRMTISYNSLIRSSVPVTVDDPTGKYNTVSIDLSGTQQLHIYVPYASMEGYKRGTFRDSSRNDVGFDEANGSLDFYLNAAWVAPRAGTLSTVVYILARAYSDLEFAEPRNTMGWNPVGSPYGRLSQVVFQSEALDPSVAIMDSYILGNTLEVGDSLAKHYTTEVAPSARALVQKPCSFAYTQTLGGAGVNLSALHFPNLATAGGSRYSYDFAGGSIISSWTWLGHYSALFTGIRGSVRWKIVIDGMDLPDAVINWYTMMYPTTAKQTIDQTVNLDIVIAEHSPHTTCQPLHDGGAVEFQIPYSSPRMYYNPRLQVTLIPPGFSPTLELPWVQQDYISSRLPAAAIPTRYVTGFLSAGDDFSVGRFRRVPSLVSASIFEPVPP